MRQISIWVPIILFSILIISVFIEFCTEFFTTTCEVNICQNCRDCQDICSSMCEKFKLHKYGPTILFIATLFYYKQINFFLKLSAILLQFFAYKYSKSESSFFDYMGLVLSAISLAVDVYKDYPRQCPKQCWKDCDKKDLIIHTNNQADPTAITVKIACEMTGRKCDYSGPPYGEHKWPIWTDKQFEHINLDGSDKNIINRFFLALLAKTEFSPDSTDVAAVEDWLEFLRLHDSENPQQFLQQFDNKLTSQQSPTTQQQNEQQPAVNFARRIINALCCTINCCCSTIVQTNNSNVTSPPYVVGEKISAIDILAAIEYHAAKMQLPADQNGANRFQFSTQWFNNILMAKIAYGQRFIDCSDIFGRSRKLSQMLPHRLDGNMPVLYGQNELGDDVANFDAQQLRHSFHRQRQSIQQQRQSSSQNCTILNIQKFIHLKLRCTADHNFGFTMRGGYNTGIPLFIHIIDNDGPAAASPMQVGDQVLEIDGNSTAQMTRGEAIGQIAGKQQIELLLRRKEL